MFTHLIEMLSSVNFCKQWLEKFISSGNLARICKDVAATLLNGIDVYFLWGRYAPTTATKVTLLRSFVQPTLTTTIGF